MDYSLCRKVMATLVVVLGMCTNGFAQAHHERMAAFEINGLTSEQRDALARDLKQDGRYRIAFACAPAGILILEPTTSANWDVATAKGMIQARITTNAVRNAVLDRRTAEARCAEARTR